MDILLKLCLFLTLGYFTVNMCKPVYFRTSHTVQDPNSNHSLPLLDPNEQCQWSLAIATMARANSKFLSKGIIQPDNSAASNNRQLILMILLLSGIESNPGPNTSENTKSSDATKADSVQYPCGICSSEVEYGQDAIQCDHCDVWTHTNCAMVSDHSLNKFQFSFTDLDSGLYL